jgi:type IV pilus assembly protein PilM
MPRKRSLLPIGIHLNLESVHLVQLEQADSTAVVAAQASQSYASLPSLPEDQGSPEAPHPIPEEAKEARYQEVRDFIRQKVSGGGFRGADAVISLPAECLTIQHVRMAPMQPEELIGALPWELRDKLPFDPKEAVIRHIVTGTVSENNEMKQDVIALATRRSLVEKHVNALGRLGLHVTGVSVEPCAMCYPYAFRAMHAPASQSGPQGLMLVYVGTVITHVAIVQGQETTFIKEVDLGTGFLTAALAKAQGLSLAEATQMRAKWRSAGNGQQAAALQEAVQAYSGIRHELSHFVDEIESCMRYHASLSRGARLDRLVFLGEEARDKALVRVLGAGLSIPCEVGDPTALVAQAGKRDEGEPELAVAVGLSLFGAD